MEGPELLILGRIFVQEKASSELSDLKFLLTNPRAPRASCRLQIQASGPARVLISTQGA